jgi:hypothetical protein
MAEHQVLGRPWCWCCVANSLDVELCGVESFRAFTVRFSIHFINFIVKAIYALPYTVLFAFLSLAYLTITFVLTLLSPPPSRHPKRRGAQTSAQDQKYTIFIHLYVFTWILLVLSTVGITTLRPSVGSGYLFSAWNAAVAAACLLVVIERIVLTSLDFHVATPHPDLGEYEELEGAESGAQHLDRPYTRLGNTDERTPLIPRDGAEVYDASLLPSLKDLSGEEEESAGAGTFATWWWIPQFLVSVPVPVALFAHVTMLVLDGTSQTLADGPSPWLGGFSFSCRCNLDLPKRISLQSCIISIARTRPPRCTVLV